MTNVMKKFGLVYYVDWFIMFAVFNFEKINI